MRLPGSPHAAAPPGNPDPRCRRRGRRHCRVHIHNYSVPLTTAGTPHGALWACLVLSGFCGRLTTSSVRLGGLLPEYGYTKNLGGNKNSKRTDPYHERYPD